MLVQNDVEYDTRVRKEAQSLAARGLEVHVLGHAAPHLPSHQLVDGVAYHRLQPPRGLASLGLRRPRPPSVRQARIHATSERPVQSRLGVLERARGHVVSAVSTVSRHTGWALATRPLLDTLQPSVVHAHDLDSLLAAGWYIRRHPNSQFVYDAHELELHRNVVWTPWRRTVARVLESRAIRAADAVITVSPLIADDLARTYRIPKPSVVLNSPALGTRLARPAMNLRGTAGIEDREILIVYVGGVLWRRGHEKLVSALAHLPARFHVGVLGAHSKAAETRLRELGNRLRVGDRLHLFGAVPANQVPATLAEGADATIIPLPNVCRSYDLALPNKLFDSVMAGVPVAVSNLEHLSRFVREHGIGLVFDETDPQSIAMAIERLVATPRERWMPPERLRELQEAVSWEVQERVLFELYDRIISSGVRP